MSAHRHWRLRVQDIIEYAAELEEMTAGQDFDAFTTQRVLQFAVMRCLEVMGEAARHVPSEIQARCPDIEWRLMNDMRNVLIHAYTIIDLRIVWNAATLEAPGVRSRLIRFLEEAQATDD